MVINSKRSIKTLETAFPSMIQRFTMFLIGVIVAFFIVKNNTNPMYNLMFILPLQFGLFYSIFPAMSQYRKGHIGMWAINVTMFIRYMITPFIIILTNYYGGYGSDPTLSSYKSAIILMSFEMAAIFIFIELIATKVYNRKYQIKNAPITISSCIVILLLLVSALGLITVYPNVISKYNFIFSSENVGQSLEIHGFFSLLIEYAKISFPLLLLSFCAHRYYRTGRERYLWLSYISVLPLIAIVSGTSRFSLVIPALASLMLLRFLYPKRKRQTTILLVTVMLLGVISITLYDSMGVSLDSASEAEITGAWMSNTMQQYFAGPRNVALGLETNELYGESISIESFLADIFLSVPLLSNFVDSTLVTNTLFNLRIYGVPGVADQIIPMVSQSVMYFGIVGAPILTCLFYYLSMYFDKKSEYDNRIEFKYLYYSAALWFGCALMINMSILVPYIFSNIIPLWIIYSINRKVRL